MKITTKKPLRPRGRSDEKRQSTMSYMKKRCRMSITTVHVPQLLSQSAVALYQYTAA